MRKVLVAGMVLLLFGAVALAATGTVKTTGPHMLDGWVITDDYGRVIQ